MSSATLGASSIPVGMTYTIISMTRKQFLMKYTSTIGEPTLQIINNWVTTKGTTLGQRGATRDQSTRTED